MMKGRKDVTESGIGKFATEGSKYPTHPAIAPAEWALLSE